MAEDQIRPALQYPRQPNRNSFSRNSLMLSRSFAASLGRKQVTVLAIAPGWVRTDMGGPHATLSVEESAHGIADVLERRSGSGRHGFVDYRGRDVAW